MKKSLLQNFCWKIAFSSALLLVAMLGFAQTPTLSSFSPVSARLSATVTITGSGFNVNPLSNTVFFGAVKAAIVPAGSSTNTLIVTVPEGASYQYISVTNLSNNLTAYSKFPFVTTFPSNGVTDFNNDANFSTNDSYSKGVAIGDLNSDGRPDLMVANANTGYTDIYLNASSTAGVLAFTYINRMPVGSPTAYPQQISIADLDGDGKLDLAVTRSANLNSYSASSDAIHLFRNITPIGSTAITFTVGPVFNSANGAFASGVNIADFDGDGKPDIVSLAGTQNRIVVFRNFSTSGTLSFTITGQTFNFTAGASGNFVAVGDLDQDGKPDVVVSTSANTLSIFHNQSTPGNINFADAFASNIDLAVGFTPYAIAIGDFDGDGNPDMAVTDQGNGRVVFFRNTNNSVSGTISFPNSFIFAFATAGGIASTGSIPYLNLSIADFDGDSKIDVAVANESASGNVLLILKNTSSGINNLSFSNRISYSIGYSNPWNLVSGDLNADGRPDVIVPKYL